MANKRMFAKSVIDSDFFLEMPATAQLLYFHLAMRADDDGFIDKPKSIMRMCCCKDDDMRVLIEKQFVIPFDSGVVVIKHWKIHNYIRKDLYSETTFLSEKSQLSDGGNGEYILSNTSNSSRSRNEPVTRTSRSRNEPVTLDIDKDIDLELEIELEIESKKGKKAFFPPSIEEIAAYCKERNNNVDAETFFDFYECKNWYVGKNKMKNWKAAVRTWEKREGKKQKTESSISAEEYQKYAESIDFSKIDV